MNRGGDYGHQLGSSRSFLESFRSACSILLIGPIHCIPLGFFQNTRKNDQYAAETIEKVQMKKLNTHTRMKYLNTTLGKVIKSFECTKIQGATVILLEHVLLGSPIKRFETLTDRS